MAVKKSSQRTTEAAEFRAERRAFVASVAARKILDEVARRLHRADIPMMPIKGVYLQLVLYGDPGVRLVSDVDVLVPEGKLLSAVRALRQDGYSVQRIASSYNEVVLQSPHGLCLDLHRRLFNPYRYRMDTGSVFSRASINSVLLSAPFYEAKPEDTFAHLVGKFVSDHAFRVERERLSELQAYALSACIAPRALAIHLARCGVHRAARLACLRAEAYSLSFFAELQLALERDVVGAGLAQAMRRAGPRLSDWGVGGLCGHLMASSLPSGGRALSRLALERLRHQMQHRWALGGGVWSELTSSMSDEPR